MGEEKLIHTVGADGASGATWCVCVL